MKSAVATFKLLESVQLASLAHQTRAFLGAAKAEGTRRAYDGDWLRFEMWCAEHSLPCLPASPDTVALYLTSLAATHKPATIRRRLTVIGRAHQAAGFPSPAGGLIVSETLKGIRRTLGTAQAGKRPLYTDQLRGMILQLPHTMQGKRDRALLLMGFAGGFRRSEIAAFRVGDIATDKDGLIVAVWRSKTDQEGYGRKVALPYGSHPDTCPVRAYGDWLKEACIEEGPVFRQIDRHGNVRATALHKDSVGLIVKRAVRRIGLDAREYAGHSLRAGLATQAYQRS